jgi:hypothetical protein
MLHESAGSVDAALISQLTGSSRKEMQGDQEADRVWISNKQTKDRTCQHSLIALKLACEMVSPGGIDECHVGDVSIG